MSWGVSLVENTACCANSLDDKQLTEWMNKCMNKHLIYVPIAVITVLV